jgi:hypothetical protein
MGAKGKKQRPRRRWKPGDIVRGWRLRELIPRAEGEVTHPYHPGGWWRAFCARCGQTSRDVHPSFERLREEQGSSSFCRSCWLDTKPVPERRCRFCQTDEPARFHGRLHECHRCERKRLRNGECQSCGVLRLRLIDRHQVPPTCPRCRSVAE